MHIEYRNPAVDNIHSVQCKYICDGAASADINFAEFGKLEFHTRLVHDAANLRDVFRICVIRA